MRIKKIIHQNGSNSYATEGISIAKSKEEKPVRIDHFELSEDQVDDFFKKPKDIDITLDTRGKPVMERKEKKEK